MQGHKRLENSGGCECSKERIGSLLLEAWKEFNQKIIELEAN